MVYMNTCETSSQKPHKYMGESLVRFAKILHSYAGNKTWNYVGYQNLWVPAQFPTTSKAITYTFTYYQHQINRWEKEATLSLLMLYFDLSPCLLQYNEGISTSSK